MTDQDALPTVTATLPLLREILIREGIEIVHAHQATSVMANESVVYASALGLPSVYTDHSLFQFDDLAGVVLNRVRSRSLLLHSCLTFISHIMVFIFTKGVTNHIEYLERCHMCLLCLSRQFDFEGAFRSTTSRSNTKCRGPVQIHTRSLQTKH